MRLHGYCQVCHKIKRVRVWIYGPRKVPVGICAACEERKRETNDR